MQPLKYSVAAFVGPQIQDLAHCLFDHANVLEHELLHHPLHALPLGCTAQRCVFANERVLTNQTQYVRRRCRRQGPNQEAGVKLATGQMLQVCIGLEPKVKLLVRSVVFVQLDNVLGGELLQQCRCPNCKLLVGQQPRLAMLAAGALDQMQSSSFWVGFCNNAFERELLHLQTHVFAFALMTPNGVGICHTLGGDGSYARFALIHFDDEGDLARQGRSLNSDLLHDFEGAQALDDVKQQRQWNQLRKHWQDPFPVECRHLRRVLHAGSQSQLRAVAHKAQVDGAGRIDLHALIGAPSGFFLGSRVVHHKSIPVYDYVCTGQSTKVYGSACVYGRQQGQVEFTGQLKPRGHMCVHALVQGLARRFCAHIQHAVEKNHRSEISRPHRSRPSPAPSGPNSTSKYRC